jgi:hypothetical protein
MPKPGTVINLRGRRFGRLKVIERAPNTSDWKARWCCRCDCGAELIVLSSNLRRGNTRSCGCLRRDRCADVGSVGYIVHGRTGTSEHRAWVNMLQRCENPNHKSYKNYGGRGIAVCERWHDFQAFVADVGPRPSPSLSLDRIDNDGGYEPGNVRWATRSEQNSNRRGRE